MGGAGGAALSPSCVPGMPGQALLVQSGQYTLLPGLARVLTIPQPTPENGVSSIIVQGQQGDFAWLAVSITPVTAYVPAQGGSNLLLDHMLLVPLGQLDAHGKLTVPLTLMPFNDPSRDAWALYFQLCVFNLQQEFFLGGGQWALQLDEQI